MRGNFGFNRFRGFSRFVGSTEGFSRFVLALAAGALVAVPAVAQTTSGALAGAGTIPGLNPNSPVKVLPVRGNIYVLMGAGANITLSVGLDGVLMVDSGSAADERSGAGRDPRRAAVGRSEGRGIGAAAPLRRGDAQLDRRGAQRRRAAQADSLHHRHEHRGRSHRRQRERSPSSGKTFTGGNVAGQLSDVGEGAAILGHENLQNRMANPPAGQPAFPTGALPDRHVLHRLDEAEQLLQRRRHRPDASAGRVHRR